MPIKMFQASGSKAVVELETQINAWAANLHATQNIQLHMSAAISEGSIADGQRPMLSWRFATTTHPRPQLKLNPNGSSPGSAGEAAKV
jgi:hypothetical protein